MSFLNSIAWVRGYPSTKHDARSGRNGPARDQYAIFVSSHVEIEAILRDKTRRVPPFIVHTNTLSLAGCKL